MKRQYFPDEEPDKDWTSVWEHAPDACTFCGQDGHKRDKCPSRPIDSWVKTT